MPAAQSLNSCLAFEEKGPAEVAASSPSHGHNNPLEEKAMDADINTTAPSDESSLAAFAAIEFDAWTETNDGPKPPTNAEFAALGQENLPYVRLAWLTMFKTKAEIVAMFEADPDLCMRLTDDFEDAREWFDSFVTLLNGARVRMLCGAAAADVTSRGDAA